MGGGTTQWLSYAHAVQSSPDKERFGKGAIEGVLGPSASNNSTLGGSLVTTISFGIPASVFMAILMGAFIMHGVVPGPDMLRPEWKGGHLGLTYSFVWIVVVSNLITVGMIFLLLKQIVKVTQVRGSLITPFILMLIYLGAFAEKNSSPDVLLVMIFGSLGWAMEKFKWPRPPLILGLVLGGLAENRLFLSVGNYGLSFLWRPMVLVLIAVILFGTLSPVVKGILQKRKRRMAEVAAGIGNKPMAIAKMNKWSGLFALFIVVVLALALVQSRNFNIRAGLFPWVIGFPLLALALVQLFKEVSGKAGGQPLGRQVEEGQAEIPPDVVNRRTAGMFGWIIGYLLGIWLLGFPIGGALCSFIQLRFASREKWLITLILAAGLWAFVYLLFEQTLHVPFPDGYLFQLLGWTE
jgi:hypothetical protein